MEYNKHLPAFPSVVHYENGRPIGFQCGELSSQEIVISKLEFFACNAPVDIPGWFAHTPPEKNVSERPKAEDIENLEDRATVKDWQYDPIYDLPEHLQWFSDKLNAVFQEELKYQQADWATRYFQWRKFYAEQLLLTLSTPQP